MHVDMYTSFCARDSKQFLLYALVKIFSTP